MTTPEQNQVLTRTGPGTPMGDVFRRYWIPMLLSSEIAERDGEPVRVKLLSERLIAFRDSSGRIGLIDEFCPHRRVSLWFGRNEENGLRCPYHGWKFDVSGQCLEIPSEEPGSQLCAKVKLKSYPCVEAGGVVWTYMGPPELRPPVPEFEWMRMPAAQRHVGKRLGECNYLQAMEGGIDSSHVSLLHSGELMRGGVLSAKNPSAQGSRGADFLSDPRAQFEVLDSPAGMYVGASRRAGQDRRYWRVTQWIMPWYTMIPPNDDHPMHGHAWVPIDDENCFAWNFSHHPTRELSVEEVRGMDRGEGIYAELIPGTFRTLANKDNDYLMDREAQKSGRYYSGIKGIAVQDASLQESMGPVVDRSLERLVASDVAIAQARRRLLQAVEATKTGGHLPGLDPEGQQVRSAAFYLPADQKLANALDVLEDAIRARTGVAHTAV